MTRIATAIDIEAPIAHVWEELADLASHAEWMADAQSIEFVGEQRHGPGTRMRVETTVGPFRTTDLLEVTVWEAPRRLAVAHTGSVVGAGEFLLHATGPSSTSLVWRESLDFPWFWGGSLTGAAAKPILRRVLANNLDRFKAWIEGV